MPRRRFEAEELELWLDQGAQARIELELASAEASRALQLSLWNYRRRRAQAMPPRVWRVEIRTHGAKLSIEPLRDEVLSAKIEEPSG